MSGNRHSDRVVLQIGVRNQGLSAGGSWEWERTALRGGASGGPYPRDWPADRPLNARLGGRATAGHGGDRQAGAPRADSDPARRRFQRVERRRVGLRDCRRSVRHWLLVEPGSSENKSYWVRLPCLPGVRNGPCGATQDTKPCPPGLGTGRRSVHRVLDSERSPSVSSGLPPLAGGNGHYRAPRAALVFVLSFVEYRLRSRFQERRHPRPIPEPQYAAARVTAPFRFTGTRWKTSVGVLAFVFALVLPAWLLPASGQFVPMLFVLRWLGLALAALAVPAIFLGFRTVTYEVDDLGVRVQRPIRCFEVRWDAMVQIESARIPSVPWAYDTEGPNRMMYGLRTKDGAVVGGVVPFAELGRGNGEVFERALWAWAAKHEIPVIEVHWRATRSWRQRRRAIRA